MPPRYAPLARYQIAGCAAFDKNLVTFWAQQWPHDDALEPRPTCVFFYYADEPEEDRWAFSVIGEATGIRGCACTAPERHWLYLVDDGALYAVGGGEEGFLANVVPGRPAYFTNLRSLRSGHVLAVGGRRKVYLREAEGWAAFGEGLFPEGPDADLGDAGFRDVDGCGLDELYAVGGRGDAWLCTAGRWQRIELGFAMGLKRVLCAADGRVYIVADREHVFVGRGQCWERISLDSQEPFESIVEFEGRVLVSTRTRILEVSAGRMADAVLPGMPVMQSVSHLATGDGVLVVAGHHEAALFDGTRWTRVLEPEA
jgi:hypothetical protein